MKKMWKKLLSVTLCCVLMASLLSVTALADGGFSVCDSEGNTVEQGSETYEVKDGRVAVYADELTFSGECQYPMTLGKDVREITLSDLTLNTTEDTGIEADGWWCEFNLAGSVNITASDTGISGDTVTFDALNGGNPVLTLNANTGVAARSFLIAMNCTFEGVGCEAVIRSDDTALLSDAALHFDGETGVVSDSFFAGDAVITGPADGVSIHSTSGISYMYDANYRAHILATGQIIGKIGEEEELELVCGEETEDGYIQDGDDPIEILGVSSISIYKAWKEESLEDVDDPVAGTAIDHMAYYDFLFKNFEQDPAGELEWITENHDGITLTIEDESIYLTMTEDALPGEYTFRVTNGEPEELNGEKNPDFVCKEETLTVTPGPAITVTADDFSRCETAESDATVTLGQGHDETGREYTLFLTLHTRQTESGKVYTAEDAELEYCQMAVCEGENTETLSLEDLEYVWNASTEDDTSVAAATVKASDGKTYKVSYSGKLINPEDLDLTIPEPEVGMTVGEWKDQIANNGRHYEILAACDPSGVFGETLDDEDVFRAGESYTFTFMLMCQQGYEFYLDYNYDVGLHTRENSALRCSRDLVFPDYALVSYDYTAPAAPDEGGENDKPVVSPETGDFSSVAVWTVLAVLSLTGMALCATRAVSKKR